MDGLKRPPPLAAPLSKPGGSSILLQRKKTFVENATATALNLLTEQEVQETPMFPVHLAPAAETKNRVPDVLLPKTLKTDGLVGVEASTQSKREAIPGSREFLLVLSSTLQKFPMGDALVGETVKSECIMIFKNFKITVWCCQGMII